MNQQNRWLLKALINKGLTKEEALLKIREANQRRAEFHNPQFVPVELRSSKARRNNRDKMKKKMYKDLIAQGFSDVEARAALQADSLRRIEENTKRQALEERWNPTQPKRPNSVRAIPVAFETDRRKH